jgi:phage tail sheath protein FI
MTYGRPGVYTNERLLPSTLAGNGTAIAAGACVGEFAQGPSDKPVLVTSWYDFSNKFGGYNANWNATFGVGQYFQNGGTELYVQRVVSSTAVKASTSILATATGTPVMATVTAREFGILGNNLRVKLDSTTTANYYNLTVLQDIVATTPSGTDTSANDLIVEQFFNVRFDDSNSSDFIETVVGNSVSTGTSRYITVTVSDKTKTPGTTSVYVLTGGSYGSAKPTTSEYTTAISLLTQVDRTLVYFAPEVHAQLKANGSSTVVADTGTILSALQVAARDYNGFAVLDAPAGTTVSTLTAFTAGLSTVANSALYFPSTYITDPVGRNSTSLRLVGPAGAMAGITISTDKSAGPFKAPAGYTASISGAISAEISLSNTDLDTLNTATKPANAIRNINGVGVVPMGARTMLQDGTANRYVSTRRSLIYIRKQAEIRAAFALFEANDERLWSRLRTSLGVFLNEFRNQGGLRGTNPSDSFYVKCDSENNTEASIANGEVHIEIGVALQYPAEFIVFTLTQKTAV